MLKCTADTLKDVAVASPKRYAMVACFLVETARRCSIT